jgi:K+-sensing histidine kinase KdpD
MRRPLSDSEVVGAALGVIVAMCVAGVLGSMRTEVSQANAGLLLVLVIIAAAATGGRWAGGATALAAAVSFDFFLTKPYGSLAIKSTDDVITTILLFIVGITVGQLANARWRHRDASQAGADEVAGLYRVASLTADGANLIEVLEGVQHEVAAVLDLESCRYEVDPTDRGLPELEPSGKVDAPYIHLGDGFVLPAGGFTIAVRAGGRNLGWLVCQPARHATGISRDRRRTALILADHLGLALAQGTETAA